MEVAKQLRAAVGRRGIDQLAVDCGQTVHAAVQCNGLNQGSATVLLEPRDGSFRMPAQNFVDMRVEKRIAMGGRQRLSLLADLFNLLNVDTPLMLISENVGTVSDGQFKPNRNFGIGDTVATPRRAMLGVRLEF